jgi:hypothetical protein
LPKRERLAREAWPNVFGKVCIECHSPDGLAAQQNAELRLMPSTYPGFLDANLKNLEHMAKLEYDGKSVLLRKPLGEMGHGGGAVLKASDPAYAELQRFVESLGSKDCGEDASADEAATELLDERASLRRASVILAGRLPTPEEAAAVEKGGEPALADALEKLMREDGFYDWLRTTFNDVFLTDRYLNWNKGAVSLLSEKDFPRKDGWFDEQSDDRKWKINSGLAREPLELIVHVVRSERPFTEIVTAPYMMVNPYSAELLEIQPKFKNAQDEKEFVEVAVKTQRRVSWPHAGVLTSPMLLNRFPTTPTNRSRGRARMVMTTFLATDVLDIASRPVDPVAASAGFLNPTRDSAYCSFCHRELDPIAGAFNKYSDNDAEYYDPERSWHKDMVPPGFGREVMSTSEHGRAPAWLGERLAKDPRFPIAMAHVVYRGLFGREPAAFPREVGDAERFTRELAVWREQERLLRRATDAFVAEKFNLRALVRELAVSSAFRASGIPKDVESERRAELADAGLGRLLSPEILSKKIRAVTGVRWTRDWDKQDLLLSEYRILYGGIDSESVTSRLSTPNGLVTSVALRMANELACKLTAWEFTRAAKDRVLLPHVTPEQLPETPGGDAVPAATDAIKQNLVHLHERVLGERLTADDPEIERSYRLFFDTWKEGVAAVAKKQVSDSINWSCQGRVDPSSGAELPEGERLSKDERYAVRAWMAVLTYLFADPRFLYE